MTEELTSRFSELVRRELGATHVVVAAVDEPEGRDALVATLSDGRRVEARFESPVADSDSLTRRLEILVRAFESVLLEDDPAPKKRAPVGVSLHDELRALAMRSSAVDALVIDAHSPVVWASALKGTTTEIEPETPPLPEEARAMLRLVRDSHRGALTALGKNDPQTFSVVTPDLDSPWEPGPAANETRAELGTRAIDEVRRLPQTATLHRGGHLAHTLRGETFGYVARGFAGIYVLVVVFDGPLDEIRVERALRDALPRIERLVLALPPLDPDPVPAGAVAIRRRRR